MTNEEMAKQAKEFRQKLELVKAANQHNVELLNQLKGAYKSKINEILDEIEDIGYILGDSQDPSAVEARQHIAKLLRRHKDD